MSDPAHEKLIDGKTYKVYRDGPDHWWDPFRYTVATPLGGVLTCTVTLWGARRAIRKRLRKDHRRSWWEFPLVAEVDPAAGDD